SEIHGIVFNDDNGNGVQDPSEAPLPWVTIKLWGPGPDGLIATAADNIDISVESNSQGEYWFENLPPGSHARNLQVPGPMDPPSPAGDAVEAVETRENHVLRTAQTRLVLGRRSGRGRWHQTVVAHLGPSAQYRTPDRVFYHAGRSSPGVIIYLNLPNRRVRTRMLGGVGGARR
ncbi:MAG: hypothetical protein ACI84D_000466, partial [Thalassolituus oleivorans]